MINDEIGKRMKHNYEEIPKIRLVRRTPSVSDWMEKHFTPSPTDLKSPLMIF